jgi:hypothetical protein
MRPSRVPDPEGIILNYFILMSKRNGEMWQLRQFPISTNGQRMPDGCYFKNLKFKNEKFF